MAGEPSADVPVVPVTIAIPLCSYETVAFLVTVQSIGAQAMQLVSEVP